jgi:hypothetical protein
VLVASRRSEGGLACFGNKQFRSSNVVTPSTSLTAIVPAFIFLACAYVLAGSVYLFAGIETKGHSFEANEQELAGSTSSASPVAVHE